MAIKIFRDIRKRYLLSFLPGTTHKGPKGESGGNVVAQGLTRGQERQQVAEEKAADCLEEAHPVGPLNGPGPTGLDSRKAGAER